MELYIKRQLNGEWVEEKCSLFGDEELELTKNWNDQQIISGYGSYSKTFSVPADEHNRKLFNFYDIIGGTLINSEYFTYENNLNPNFTLPARLIINEFEIIGNVQLQGFSTNNMFNYSYNLNFYGEEKNLLKELNRTDVNSYNKPKLNDIDLGSDIEFKLNFNNVTGTWYGENSLHFVPQFSNLRPLNYRDEQEINNINPLAGGLNNTTGITMRDLAVSYNFKQLLDKMFANYGMQIQHSSEILKFLYELYIMPNSKIEYGGNILMYNFSLWQNYTTFAGTLKNIAKWSSYSSSNTDTSNFDPLTDIYTAPSTGDYSIAINVNYIMSYFNIIGTVQSYDVFIVNYDTGVIIKSASFNPPGVEYITVKLDTGTKIQVLFSYVYTEPNFVFGGGTTTTKIFPDYTLSGNIKINLATDAAYDYYKSSISFPDMLFSDFFVQFCKSFNIFFQYKEVDIENQKNRIVYTYFKNELERNIYDLTEYLLLDKQYTFNNSTKYKLIDYKFNDAKDINNIAWKQEKVLAFGESKTYYNYDVGIDKLEFKSIFTVFPRTTLNKTDRENTVLQDTEIPLHSELSENYSPLNTDFLLFYKEPAVSGVSYYNLLADGSGSFLAIDFASSYGPDGQSGYTLDYNYLNVIKDNISTQYETTLEFILPSEFVHTLKVYDYVIVRNIWYEISEINVNIRTGLTKIKLISVPIPIILQPYGVFAHPAIYSDSASGACSGTQVTVYSRDYNLIVGSTIYSDSTMLSGFTLGEYVLFDPRHFNGYVVLLDTNNDGFILGVTTQYCDVTPTTTTTTTVIVTTTTTTEVPLYIVENVYRSLQYDRLCGENGELIDTIYSTIPGDTLRTGATYYLSNGYQFNGTCYYFANPQGNFNPYGVISSVGVYTELGDCVPVVWNLDFAGNGSGDLLIKVGSTNLVYVSEEGSGITYVNTGDLVEVYLYSDCANSLFANLSVSQVSGITTGSTSYCPDASISIQMISNGYSMTVGGTVCGTVTEPFTTEWFVSGDTTERTITLPLVTGYAYDAVVDWGDTTVSTIQSSGDTGKIHTYSDNGTYVVKVYGDLEAWSFNNVGDKLKITKVLSFGGNDFGGFKYLTAGFRGCTNLSSLGTDKIKISGVGPTSLANCFESVNITTIPTGIFDNCISVVTFRYTFGVSSINSIPNDLFRYNINAEVFDSCFINVDSIGSIPDNLFAYNTVARNFDSCFEGCINLQLNSTMFGTGTTRFLNQPINFRDCFKRVSFTGTQGTAPELWNFDYGTETPIKTNCFDGAGNSITSLTNYNDIPIDWL